MSKTLSEIFGKFSEEESREFSKCLNSFSRRKVKKLRPCKNCGMLISKGKFCTIFCKLEYHEERRTCDE